MNLIYIFFIFLFICVKNKNNNETEFNLETFIDYLLGVLKKNTSVIEVFEEQWNKFSYPSKNIFYQNIPLIKERCFNSTVQPTTCKLLFDILGIL